MGIPARKVRAVVIGSGPNGLAAAVMLARAGVDVEVREAAAQAGGCARSGELTLPGFVHDLASAVHPMAVASPCFERMPLRIDWVHPDAPLAHPLDDGTAVLLERSVERTADGLGPDRAAWRRLFDPLVENWPELREDVLGAYGLPRYPLAAMRFGMLALAAAETAARQWFSGERARALFAGLAAHSCLPLQSCPSGAVGLALAVAGQSGGWPFPRGGAQRIATALEDSLREAGGVLRTNAPVTALPEADLVLCDVGPAQLLSMAGDRLPPHYARRLRRFRYGPGAFKMDWALDGPIPWTARACARAGTVHLGGSLEEIAAAEGAVPEGRSVERPFVLLAQPSLFDTSRAPAGMHTAWAYCHVPNGSSQDMTARVEAQVERFAPGFGSRILARSAMGPAALERYNPNLVGGDVSGGAATLGQLIFRPTGSGCATPLKGVYLCSASTPPGGGVHGMCGYHAARAALRGFRIGPPPF